MSMAKTKLKRARRAINNDIYSDLNKIKNALADATNAVSGKAGDLLTHRWSDIQDKTAGLESNVVDYVTYKPIKSISLAVLAGVAIGLYLRK
jgi:ElaB/YqjD/DUF883 family membrane-anchored ribosome-binding protein